MHKMQNIEPGSTGSLLMQMTKPDDAVRATCILHISRHLKGLRAKVNFATAPSFPREQEWI